MKVVIFAGGVGSRLWPLSRKNTPKQFEKIIGDKSTLQQTIARLYPEFKPEDIYIATGKRYEKTIREQLPEIPHDNFIFEPEMRDVGPAIGLVSVILDKISPNEPMAILWSDHMVKHVDVFKKSLSMAKQMISLKKADFVFIAQKPRFANQNIGWIQIGTQTMQELTDGSIHVNEFIKLKYRPKLEDAQSFFKNENFVWNLGYFVTTPSYLTSLYIKHASNMCESLVKIRDTWKTDQFEKTLEELYPTLEKISFDDAILEKLDPKNMYVISGDIGWSDVGAWEALKEALTDSKDENLTKGKLLIEESKDCLVFNYTDQLVVGIDLQEMIIINTSDVTLVCPKTAVPKIKKLVESLAGTPHEHLA